MPRAMCRKRLIIRRAGSAAAMSDQDDFGNSRLASEKTHGAANIQCDQLPVHGGFAVAESGPDTEGGNHDFALRCRSWLR